MTETLLALVPTYGIWLVFFSLLLSCLALPLPSSILMMAAGGFAATGDLQLWQVQVAGLAGFIVGDQAAYAIARGGGRGFVERMKTHPRFAGTFERAQALLLKGGAGAVFASRTIFSPLGPYIGYLSGALRMAWPSYTLAAVAGALCWSFAYSLLGYYFATRISQIASMIGNAIGIVTLAAVTLGMLWYLIGQWRASQADEKQSAAT